MNRNTRRIAELLLPARERKRSERKKRKSEHSKVTINSSMVFRIIIISSIICATELFFVSTSDRISYSYDFTLQAYSHEMKRN